MERNISIDYFKIVLCILVIMIHMQPLFTPDSLLGWFLSNGIGRIGVPCFFIINGFYLHSKISSGKAILKYLKRLIIIYITWTFVFLLFTIKYTDIRLIFSLLFGIYHLWYLSALIGGVIIFYFLKKVIKNDFVLLIISIALFITGMYIQNNYFPVADAAIRVFMYRNALFFCFPFVFLGYFINEKKETLKQVNNALLLLIIVASLLVLLYEVSRYYNDGIIMDMYYSIIILAPALLALILKKAVYKRDDGYIGLLTSGIYYIHPLIIYILSVCYPLNEKYIYILPVVLVLSAITTAGVIEVNKRIKIFL